MSWFDSDFTKRIAVTVQSSKVDATLTNFPVYFDLSRLDSNYWSIAEAGGGALRITTSNGVTRVPLEIKNFNDAGSSGTGQIYFLAPTLSSSVDTKFYIYWGKSGATQPASDSTYGSENVWVNYEYVLHHEEDPAGSPIGTDVILDSTGNGYHFSSDGTMTSGDLVTAVAGNGIEFDATDDLLRRSNMGDISFKSTADWTIESFQQCDPSLTSGSNYMLVAQHDSGTGPSRDYLFMGYMDATDKLRVAGGDLGSGNFVINATTSTSTLAWRHAAVTHEAGSPATIRLYLDGGEEGNTTYSPSWDASNNSNYVTISGYYSSGTPVHILDGIQDEVRFSNVVREEEYIDATYNNLFDENNFTTLGIYESAPTGIGGMQII